MPRDLPIGNGRMLVTFDDDYLIRDLYYPVRRQGEPRRRLSVPLRRATSTARFTWVRARHGWTHRAPLRARHAGHPRHLRATRRWACAALLATASTSTRRLFVRRVEITNLRRTAREVRLFFHHDFRITESDVGDTAAYDPATQRRRALQGLPLFPGQPARRRRGRRRASCAIGQKGAARQRRAPGATPRTTATSSSNPIAQGAVDSVVGRARAGAGARRAARSSTGSPRGPRWKGDWDGVDELNAKVVERGPDVVHASARATTGGCGSDKEPIDFFDLPPTIVDLYQRSLLIAAHADRQRRRDHRRQRQRHHALRARHLLVHVAARRRAGGARARLAGLSGAAAPVLPVLRRRAHARGLPPAQVQPGRSLGIVVAPVGRPRRRWRHADAAAADPGGRDRAGGLGAVAALPALPRHRGSCSRSTAAWSRRRRDFLVSYRDATPSCRRRATTCGKSGAGS